MQKLALILLGASFVGYALLFGLSYAQCEGKYTVITSRAPKEASEIASGQNSVYTLGGMAVGALLGALSVFKNNPAVLLARAGALVLVAAAIGWLYFNYRLDSWVTAAILTAPAAVGALLLMGVKKKSPEQLKKEEKKK